MILRSLPWMMSMSTNIFFWLESCIFSFPIFGIVQVTSTCVASCKSH